MDYKTLFGQVAGLVALAAFVPYIVSILLGKTRPNRATWIIWTLVGVMLATSYHYSGDHLTIWVPVSYVIGPFVTMLLSIRYGEGGWTSLDRACLLLAVVSVFPWWLTGEPLVALLLNLFVDSLGVVPTLHKAYTEPETEDRLTWSMFCLANTLNLFALRQGTFAETAYPVYMFVAVGLVTIFIFVRRYQLRHQLQLS